MRKIILETIISKMRANPKWRRNLALAGILGFFVLFLTFGAAMWFVGKAYTYVASSVPSVEQVSNNLRSLALTPDAPLADNAAKLLDKPLLSQNCLNSSMNLINPSALLTQPIANLLNQFKESCLGTENKKEAEPTEASKAVDA